MSTQDDDNQGVMWVVLIGAVLLAISLAIGFGLYRTMGGAAPATAVAGSTAAMGAGGTVGAASATDGAAGAAQSTDSSATGAAGVAAGAAGAAAGTANGAAPATTADMTTAAADGPSIRVENGVVKFYFASGSAELAPGAADALGDVVKGVAAGQTAVISGYHDVTGDPAKNEELAKQRAFAVRDALKALGIGDDKLDLKKPEVTTATGSNAEARRVEVSLQ